MESFLGDLAVAQVRRGQSVAGVVHGPKTRVSEQNRVLVYEASARGELLYAPVSPSFPRVLARAVREFRPDVIHAHVPNLSALWLLSLPKARRVPWVVQWQSDIQVAGGPKSLRLAYHLYRWPESALLRRARAIVCSSPDYLEASAPLAPWQSKVRVIPLGIDPGRVAVDVDPKGTESAWPGNDPLRVLVVGRLAHYKGHHVLLEALRKATRVSVVIVGTGELDRRLRQLAGRLGVTERVRFFGAADADTLNALLHACHVLCLPSTARTESFGIVLLEAMAVGRPVIATEVPGSGMPWLVRTAQHGILARPGDPDSLAQALQVMQDASRRERLGAAGTRALEECFHIDRVAEEIDLLYRNAIESRAS